MNDLLLIIDLQYDFINNNTKNIIDRIQQLLLKNEYKNVVFTQFINNKKSPFFTNLNYKGCLTNAGRKIMMDTLNYPVIKKEMYSALNIELKNYLKENKIKNIFLCGIETECCVLKTALDVFENNYNVYVLKDYCASTHGMINHNSALEIIGRCIGKNKII